MPATARSADFLVCVPLCLLACALPAAALAADASDPVRDLLRDAAGAMAESNARRFFRYVDPELPEYARLERDLTALIEQYDVTVTIDILADEGDGRARSLQLDWYMQIRARGGVGLLERRRQTIQCRIEKKGKQWRITALAPVDFFTPPAR